MTKIELIYFDAGGGHRASATALKAMIEQQQRPWDVRMVNLREVLDPQDKIQRTLGLRVEDGYNKFIAKGWTWGATTGLRFLQSSIRLLHKPLVRRLQAYWEHSAPDLVVSLIPNFDRALHDGLQAALPSVPFVTLITDLADFPPHFWIEPKQNQSLICGSPKAVAQAKAQGYGDSAIYPTSGMILRPQFYQTETIDRAAERRKLGLDPDLPTGIVLFGGQGARVMGSITKRLQDTQLILICGHNAALAAKLRAMPARAPRHIVEFTQEIPHYMRCADFFIGKPGPGSISEAVRMGLPVIVEANRQTLPQERYNAVWVRENEVGIVLKHFRDVQKGVAALLTDLLHYKAQTAKLDNRAVFEIPDILEKILQQAG